MWSNKRHVVWSNKRQLCTVVWICVVKPVFIVRINKVVACRLQLKLKVSIQKQASE